MDGQRLYPHLRRPAADRRHPRRALRPAAALRCRPGHLHTGLGGRRSFDGGRSPGRSPCCPGCRRCGRHPADAHPARGRGPARTASTCARRVGRHRRPRHRSWPAGRRGDSRGGVLAMDLLGERADRPGAGAARLRSPHRGQWRAEAPRPPRPGPGERGAVRGRVRPRPQHQPRVGVSPGQRPLGGWDGPARRLCPRRAAGGRADAAPCGSSAAVGSAPRTSRRY